MKIDDREDFVDMIAQAVIDKMDEQNRIHGMVNLVVARVMELQTRAAELKAAADAEAKDRDGATTTAPE